MNLDCKEVRSERVGCLYLDQVRALWRALVNTVMNVRINGRTVLEVMSHC